MACAVICETGRLYNNIYTCVPPITANPLYGLLVQFHKAFRSNGGRLVLVSLTENVRKVVEITRLFKVFEIFPSKEEALRSVKSAG